MYAIVREGGKQYRIKEGDIIDVELVKGSSDDNKVIFKEVLLFSDGKAVKVGAPHVADATIEGELLQEVLGVKTTVFKYKKRKSSRRKIGHRQRYSRIKITKLAAK